MTPFDAYVRRIFMGTLLLVLAAAAVALALGSRPWARGMVLGGAASLVNLLIMSADVRRYGSRTGGRAAAAVMGRYSLRLAVMAASLTYAALNEQIALWGTIPALFSSQIIMTLGELVSARKKEAS